MALPTPATPSGAAGLAAILADPTGAVLAFDYDGVLAPIVDDPKRAVPHPGAIAALARLAPHVASVAIITGRPAAVAVSLAGFDDRPELRDLVVFGHYGLERWEASGRLVAPAPSPGVVAARGELPRLLARLNAPPGIWVEDKGSSIAVHTRRASDPGPALELIRGPVTDLAARHDLTAEPGRMVVELRPRGTDKGRALRGHVAHVGASSVAYTGDDLGDLAAFAAVDSLRAEGLAGLKVCSGSREVTELARRADLVVAGPIGVVDLVNALAEALERR